MNKTVVKTSKIPRVNGRMGLGKSEALLLLDTVRGKTAQIMRVRSMSQPALISYWLKLRDIVAVHPTDVRCLAAMKAIVQDEAARRVQVAHDAAIEASLKKSLPAARETREALRTSARRAKGARFATQTPSNADYVPDAHRQPKAAGKICGGF